jgi:hypothetical protein
VLTIGALRDEPPEYDHTAIAAVGRLSVDALNAALQDDLPGYDQGPWQVITANLPD